MSIHQTTRREFLKILGTGALAASFPSIGRGSRQTKQPNILFLFTDDQRFDTIRAWGNQIVQTPNLDKLVKNGISFTNAYIMGGTSGAVCMPSRAMLLTGRGLFHLQGKGESIPRDHVMMPEFFRNLGYKTFGIGKWHNGREAFARCFTDGDEIMFGGMSDHWNVPVYHFDPSGSYKTKIPVIRNPYQSNQITYIHGDHITEGKHSSELFADAAIRFLKGYHSTEPFFLYVAFTAPHDPRTAPPEFLKMYEPEKIPLPPNFRPVHPFDNGEMNVRDEKLAPRPRQPEEIRRHIAEYYAIISHLDAQIGHILAALEKSGQADNTLIVFTSDNGLALGRHGLLGKQNVYEHSVHVPLIISGPGIPRGEKRSHLCYLYDIFPTLCDLVGVPPPASVEGLSLAPVINDRKRNTRPALYFAYRHFQRALRTERWKLILYNVKGEKHTQLFDLENDPWETDNLAEKPAYSKQVRRLTEQLQTLMNKADDPVRLSESVWKID